MCKPKPGPRCSPHARERLIQSLKHHDEAKKKMVAAQRAFDRSGGNDYNAHKQFVSEKSLYNRAVRILRTAQWEYDTCPEGLKKLSALVEKEIEGGNEQRIIALKIRLGKAIEGRKGMLAEYNALLAQKREANKK